MKLIFNKAEDAQITVLQNIDDEDLSFSYIGMIKNLIKFKKMGEPEFSGDFSDAEKKSITDMVGYINDVVAEVEKPAEPSLSLPV